MTAAVRVVAAGPVWPAAAAWEMGRVMRESDGWGDFAEFVTAAMPGLLRYGHALTGNPHDAADLVQGVLEKVGVRWAKVVRQADDPLAYTRRAMANAHISRLTAATSFPDKSTTAIRMNMG